jgi:tRNA 2-thiocytidine biosynthesis protein TtcA
MAFIDENTIKRFTFEEKLPVFVNPCPSAKTSKRQEIKALLKRLYSSNKKIKGNIFRAMSHIKTEYMLEA